MIVELIILVILLVIVYCKIWLCGLVFSVILLVICEVIGIVFRLVVLISGLIFLLVNILWIFMVIILFKIEMVKVRKLLLMMSRVWFFRKVVEVIVVLIVRFRKIVVVFIIDFEVVWKSLLVLEFIFLIRLLNSNKFKSGVVLGMIMVIKIVSIIGKRIFIWWRFLIL